jgi:hypothetical protein
VASANAKGLRLFALNAVLGAGLTLTGPSAAASQSGLVGSWRLVSAVATKPGGVSDSHPYGNHPKGLLFYMADGRVTALISYDARSLLNGDRVSAPVAERAEAFATFFAYSGTFELKGDTVIHHVEIASVPNWVGTNLVRVVVIHGDRLTLSTPPISVGGKTQTTELVWERMK